jgi:hypothetical protein
MNTLTPSNQISKWKISEKDIILVIKDQLAQINSQIITHPQQLGINYIIYNLSNHIFNGMSLIDSQRLLAVRLMKEIEDKGYGVRILLDKEPKLVIKWFTIINKDDIDIMNDHIKTKRINESELNEYLKDGNKL